MKKKSRTDHTPNANLGKRPLKGSSLVEPAAKKMKFNQEEASKSKKIDEQTMQKASNLRDDGLKWNDIASKLNLQCTGQQLCSKIHYWKKNKKQKKTSGGESNKENIPKKSCSAETEVKKKFCGQVNDLFSRSDQSDDETTEKTVPIKCLESTGKKQEEYIDEKNNIIQTITKEKLTLEKELQKLKDTHQEQKHRFMKISDNADTLRKEIQLLKKQLTSKSSSELQKKEKEYIQNINALKELSAEKADLCTRLEEECSKQKQEIEELKRLLKTRTIERSELQSKYHQTKVELIAKSRQLNKKFSLRLCTRVGTINLVGNFTQMMKKKDMEMEKETERYKSSHKALLLENQTLKKSLSEAEADISELSENFDDTSGLLKLEKEKNAYLETQRKSHVRMMKEMAGEENEAIVEKCNDKIDELRRQLMQQESIFKVKTIGFQRKFTNMQQMVLDYMAENTAIVETLTWVTQYLKNEGVNIERDIEHISKKRIIHTEFDWKQRLEDLREIRNADNRQVLRYVISMYDLLMDKELLTEINKVNQVKHPYLEFGEERKKLQDDVEEIIRKTNGTVFWPKPEKVDGGLECHKVVYTDAQREEKVFEMHLHDNADTNLVRLCLLVQLMSHLQRDDVFQKHMDTGVFSLRGFSMQEFLTRSFRRLYSTCQFNAEEVRELFEKLKQHTEQGISNREHRLLYKKCAKRDEEFGLTPVPKGSDERFRIERIEKERQIPGSDGQEESTEYLVHFSGADAVWISEDDLLYDDCELLIEQFRNPEETQMKAELASNSIQQIHSTLNDLN